MSATGELTDPRLDALWQALSTVVDPEIGLDIVTLGMVYAVEIRDDVAMVTHTLTRIGCPMERAITEGIRNSGGVVPGLRGIETRLVWEPAWHPGMIASDEPR